MAIIRGVAMPNMKGISNGGALGTRSDHLFANYETQRDR